jgi:hypothetical protein
MLRAIKCMLRGVKRGGCGVGSVYSSAETWLVMLQSRCSESARAACVVMMTTNQNVSPLCLFWTGAAESVRESFPTRDPSFSSHS